jgi:hypothetical protein
MKVRKKSQVQAPGDGEGELVIGKEPIDLCPL